MPKHTEDTRELLLRAHPGVKAAFDSVLPPPPKRAKSDAEEGSSAGSSSSDAAPAETLSIVVATAGSKGRKQTMEDVPVLVPWLDKPADVAAKDLGTSPPSHRRAFHAILDGHGGRNCADWVAGRLPALLASRLEGVVASAAIKEAVKAAFAQCDEELLAECERRGWSDGCCAIGLLLDLHCAPPRAYVANLGDSRAYAAVGSSAVASAGAAPSSAGFAAAAVAAPAAATAPAAVAAPTAAGGGGGLRAVALSKDHTPLDVKEKRRITAAGGFVEDGRVGGMLEVSRSLGDPRCATPCGRWNPSAADPAAAGGA